MKLAISITTCERPAPLLALLNELEEQLDYAGHEAEIFVVNDGSLRKYTKVKAKLDAMPWPTAYERFTNRQGKHHHWRVVDRIFRWFKRTNFDLAIYLQDDLILDKDFISRGIEIFEAIQHSRKVCLNVVLEESRNGVACWTPGPALNHKFGSIKLYKVGWVELHFIANREFFRVLDYTIHPVSKERWENNPHLSSGVGRQISTRLFRARKAMYQVKKSLAAHGHYPSQMNPENERKNRLRSI